MTGWVRRLLIVEDEALTAGLLAEALTEVGFDVAVASSADAARTLVADFDPDVALLDIHLGAGPSGVHLAHALRALHPQIAIIMLTQYADTGPGSGFDLPASIGYLRKHLVGDVAALKAAIESVLADAPEHVPGAVRPSEFAELGAAGARVWELLAEGYDNAAIAARAHMSLKSVERWLGRIYLRLGIDTKGEVNPRVEAARRYYLVSGIPGRLP